MRKRANTTSSVAIAVAITLGTALMPAPVSGATVGVALAAASEDLDRGRELLDEREYLRAAEAFAAAAAERARDADAALYWQAYSLEQATRYAEAQEVLAVLRAEYPDSAWRDDARVLAREMRDRARAERDGYSYEYGYEELTEDEQLQLYAIQALMNADPEQAVPVLQRYLAGDRPTALKRQALFVLSQSGDEAAVDTILEVVRSDRDPALQAEAARMLMLFGYDDHEEIAGLYDETQDQRVKHALLQGAMAGGNEQLLARVARDESDPELQVQAIHMLGASGASDELTEIYHDGLSREVKGALLDAFAISGDTGPLEEILRSESDPEVRTRALRAYGIAGDAGDIIPEIYPNLTERNEKQAAIEALMISGDGGALRALYQQEQDPEVKRYIIQMMSVSGDDESMDLFLEILEDAG